MRETEPFKQKPFIIEMMASARIGLLKMIHKRIYSSLDIALPLEIYSDIENDRGPMERYVDQLNIRKMVAYYVRQINYDSAITDEALSFSWLKEDDENYDKEFKKLYQKTIKTIKKSGIKACYGRWIGATSGLYLFRGTAYQNNLRVCQQLSLAARRSLMHSASQSDLLTGQKIDKIWLNKITNDLSYDPTGGKTFINLNAFVSSPVLI